MKILLLLLGITVFATSCSGPGGPATRTGRVIDNSASAVGRGVERTGEVIQDVAQ